MGGGGWEGTDVMCSVFNADQERGDLISWALFHTVGLSMYTNQLSVKSVAFFDRH